MTYKECTANQLISFQQQEMKPCVADAKGINESLMERIDRAYKWEWEAISSDQIVKLVKCRNSSDNVPLL